MITMNYPPIVLCNARNALKTCERSRTAPRRALSPMGAFLAMLKFLSLQASMVWVQPEIPFLER